MDRLDKDQIKNLLPHREPMLLIDELYNINTEKLENLIDNLSTFQSFIKTKHYKHRRRAYLWRRSAPPPTSASTRARTTT